MHGFAPGKAQTNDAVYQNALVVDASHTQPVSFADHTFYHVGDVATSSPSFKGDDLFALKDDTGI